MNAFVTSTDCPRVSSKIELCSAPDDMDLSPGQRGYHGRSTPWWFSQERPYIGQRLRYMTFKTGSISVVYPDKTSIEQKSN